MTHEEKHDLIIYFLKFVSQKYEYNLLDGWEDSIPNEDLHKYIDEFLNRK